MKANYGSLYDHYARYYNSGKVAKIRKCSELNVVRNEIERQIEHLNKIISSRIREINVVLDYEFQIKQTDDEAKEMKKRLKTLIHDMENGTKQAVSAFSKMWLSNLENDLKHYVQKYNPEKDDKLAFIHFKSIVNTIDRIKLRNMKLSCLDQILLQIVDTDFDSPIPLWMNLEPEIQERVSGRGRPADESANQKEIYAVVKKLIEYPFFKNKDGKVKPTTIRDFLMDPFNPKYEKKNLVFSKEEKIRFKESIGFLEKTQVFTRVSEALNEINPVIQK